MNTSSLLQRIARKDSDPAKIAAQVIKSPELIAGVMEGLGADNPAESFRPDEDAFAAAAAVVEDEPGSVALYVLCREIEPFQVSEVVG